jgi:hypothetical protein
VLDLRFARALFEARAGQSAALRAASQADTEAEKLVMDRLIAEHLDLAVLYLMQRLLSRPAGEAFTNLVRDLSRPQQRRLEAILLQGDDRSATPGAARSAARGRAR